MSTDPKIAICAVGEPNAENLGEWVKYHLGIEIDKIFLYNNGTADDMQYRIDEELMKEEDKKVEIVDFPNQSEYKRKAYGDCFEKQRENFDWIVFFDIDKFLALPHNQSIKEIFSNEDLNEKYLEHDQIRINSIMFTDLKQLSIDLGLPTPTGDNSIPKPYLAKTIVNCKATGVYFTEFAIQRNGTPPTQCLPNLVELPPSNEDVQELDTNFMYATSNYMEIMWLDWKRATGY